MHRIRTHGRSGVFHTALFFLFVSLTLWPTLEAFADEWNEMYQRGVSELERGNWERAVREFQAAINKKSKPEAQATTSSLNMVPYVPYFRLGHAYLLGGKYQLALESFRKSKQYGAINDTAYRRSLERYLEMAEKLQSAGSQEIPEIEKKFRNVEQLILAESYGEAEKVLSQIQDYDKRIAVFEKWIQSAETRATREGPRNTGSSPAEESFNRGLDYYLTGQYEEALREFRVAERLDPEGHSVANWITKTRRDMARLNAEKQQPQEDETSAPEVIEKIVRQTTEPVIAISSPAKPFSEVRSREVRFSGRVGDDQGLARIEFILNGQPILRATTDSVKILATGGIRNQVQNASREFAWASRDSSGPGANDGTRTTKCTFAVDIPLQLGENQVSLTASDVDSVSHRTVEQLSVIRKPALYQTGGFWISIGAVLLLTSGGIVLSKMIKYRIAIVNKYNPYIAGSPIRTEEMFFGREKLIQRILNTLHNNSLMIYGPRRIGKTSLQHQLKRRLENLNDVQFEFVPVLIDLQGTSERRFFTTLMEEIVEACKSRTNGDMALRLFENEREYSGRDFSRDLKKVVATLQSKTAKTLKLVLLIDEVDELNKYSEKINQRLRSVFMKTFAENLVAVMSGAYIRKNWESEGSPWYNFFEEIEVPPFAREDAEALIRMPVKGIFDYEEAAIEKIIELSECQPYIIQRFCINVINRIIEDKRRRVTVSDVEAIAGQILKDS